MFVVAGMFCWSMPTLIRILEAIPVKDIPYEILFLQAMLLPNQGTFDLLVYVAPALLYDCCCNTGHGEVLVSSTSYISLNPGTKLSEPNVYANLDEPISVSFERKQTSVFQKFRAVNATMSFFDGHGRLALSSTMRERLSIKNHHSTSDPR